MKLSANDVRVLRNFSTINPSVQFSAGNVLRTISPNKTILAEAKLDESVPSTFAIYDLSRFLGVLSLFKEPVLEVGDRSVKLVESGRKVNYVFADPATLILPPDKKINVNDFEVTFEMKEEHLSEIMKALGVLSLPELAVVGEEGKIYLRAVDTKNASQDNYDIEVGETDKTFNVVFKTENMKLLPGDYNVSIARGISKFERENLQYWIAIESNSTFDK